MEIELNRVLFGDALEQLRQLPSDLVQTCVTSPPYWAMRDYQAEGQIGLEDTPEAYVERLVDVFREVRRVLRDDGTLWINIGDVYASPPPGNKIPRADRARGGLHSAPRAKGRILNTVVGNLKDKDLVGTPWMLALALRADGWYLRADIIWDKLQNLPESVQDRPTKAHEYILLFSKSRHYVYDREAVPSCSRSVWSIVTNAKASEHTATYPIELPRRCIQAASKPGDIVLDPFLGSGTTAAAAVELRRQWIGIELNSSCAPEIRGSVGDAEDFSDQRSLFEMLEDNQD